MNSNASPISYLDHDGSSTHLSLTTTLSVSTMDGSENLGVYNLTQRVVKMYVETRFNTGKQKRYCIW